MKVKINGIEFEQTVFEHYNDHDFAIADMESKAYSVLKNVEYVKYKPNTTKRGKVIQHLITESIKRLGDDRCLINTCIIEPLIKSIDNTKLENCTEQRDGIVVYRPLFWLSEGDVEYYIKKYEL